MSGIIVNETSGSRLLKQVIKLSIPAILAELTSVVMQYIDAAMVGSLGREATAAIGLVSTTTWLIGGLCISLSMGFSVQIAHLIGAGNEKEARNVLRQSLLVALIFGCMLSLFSVSIHKNLPVWLGGNEKVIKSSSAYFLIFSCALPFEQLRMISSNILQCSGNMKTPSLLNILLCILDVIFNFLFIFPTRQIDIPLLNAEITAYGAGMGVKGAALGTAASEIVITVLMLYFLLFRSNILSLRKGGSWKLKKSCLKKALKISLPAAFEHTATCGAYVAATKIIAPLGNVSIAANSLAVTAESFCYMPGYGIGSAATTLVGQSLGAKRRDLAKKYALITITLGVVIMSVLAVVMYITAPFMFSILINEQTVRDLGANVLRIEAFAEPLYGASIVCSGVLRGAGDTLFPSIINLVSMWGVRITLSIFLVSSLGLKGIWLAMCIELCFRGVLFLIRTMRGKWLGKVLI